MPPKKVIKETENTVRQGLTNKNCLWINMKAYQLLQDGSFMFSAGGKEDIAETELVREYITKNKLTYHNHIITAQIEYNEKLTFGKYLNKTVDEVKNLDYQYLRWARDNYTFKIGEEKLKNEIINCLK